MAWRGGLRFDYLRTALGRCAGSVWAVSLLNSNRTAREEAPLFYTRETTTTTTEKEPEITTPTTLQSLWNNLRSFHNSIYRNRYTLAEAAQSTSVASFALPASPTNESSFSTIQQPNESHIFDFVIVGHGTAGQACFEQLRHDCPTARIAVVDPHCNSTNKSISTTASDKKSNCCFVSDCVTGLDPVQRTVQLHGTTSDGIPSQLRYRQAVLIATGARGAPPPSYLVDESIRELVWELNSTHLVQPLQEHSSNAGSTMNAPDSRPTVRARVLQAAQQGQTVGILGSGWDALDLAVAAASVCHAHNQNRPQLIFGPTTPLSTTLPSYLSVAVRKRLKRIVVQDQMVVRYISKGNSAGGTGNSSHALLQLYTARSNDFKEGRKTPLDCLVIAPETAGPTGNAAIPTDRVPPHLQDTAKGRPWYQTWANLSTASSSGSSTTTSASPLIVCYNDDGRIAVNPELQACTGVYAAGGVAKCANPITGHADVAGFGAHDAVAAGQVAAKNMARGFFFKAQQSGSLFGTTRRGRENEIFTKEPLSIWRSDLRAPACPTSLQSVGIQALCVGNCDAERFSTHGIWWTNQAAQQRMMRMIEKEEQNVEKGGERLRKRRKTRRKEAFVPVYGLGVVYYLDRNGKIHGIMLWGLPFTNSRRHGHKKEHDPALNRALTNHLKELITTNGGFYAIESDRDQIRRANYLTDQSRQIVARAFSSAQQTESELLAGKNTDWKDFPRPLHRFTEMRPPSVRSLGVLRRRDGHGHGILGQDLFDCQEYVGDGLDESYEPDHNTPLVGSALAELEKTKTMHEWAIWEQKEKMFDENEARARPPKEDPMWIRKGDEMRNLTAHDSLSAAYGAVLWPGAT